MRSLALGWQLARRSWRDSLPRTASMALGMVLAGFVAAAIVGVPAVFDGRTARIQATSVVGADGPVPDGALLGARYEESVAAGRLDRILIADSGAGRRGLSVTLPPGVSGLPRPGEVVLSPALADLADDDPLIGQRFPQRRIGMIGADGLVEPGQLVAYVGVEPGDRLFPIGFGSIDVWQSPKPGEVAIAMVVAAAFLMLPAGMFLATASRLSARTRDERLASLRLLGLSRRAVRTVNAVETALVAALGAAAGCLAWAVVQYPLGRFGVGGFRWFAADAPVQPLTVAAIALVAAIAAVIVGTVTANDAIDEPLGARRRGTPTLHYAWRATALGAGAAMLYAAYLRSDVDTVFAVLLVVGGFLSAVGTALATPVVSRLLGVILARRPTGPTRMLVARRLDHEPSAAGRVLAAVLVATFALGVGHGGAGAFEDASWDPSADAQLSITTSLSEESIAALPGVEVALPQVITETDAVAHVATCGQLEALLSQPLPSCVDGAPFELVYGDWPSESGAPVLVADFPTDSTSSINGLILPPTDAVGLPVESWVVRIDPAARESFLAALVGADPGAFGGNWPDDTLADLVAALVTAGAVAAFVIGLAAVVVATADRAVERRSLDANLLAGGIPGRILRRAQMWTVSLPVVVTVTVAALIGTLTGHLYRQAGADDAIGYPWDVAMTSSAVGLAAAIVAGALAHGLARTGSAPATSERNSATMATRRTLGCDGLPERTVRCSQHAPVQAVRPIRRGSSGW